MRKFLASVAAVLFLFGSFCLPSFATSEAVSDFDHSFKIYVPHRELILDNGGLGDTDTLDRNYINAFDVWKTIEGPTNVPLGVPISYRIRVYKRETFANGEYNAYVSVNCENSLTQDQFSESYSVNYINSSVVPTGIAWRIRGSVDPFVIIKSEVSVDGSFWEYVEQVEYEFTLETGKSSTYTMFLYNPKVEWLTFDQLREDQSILEDYYVGVTDFYDRVWDDWNDAPKDFGGCVLDLFDLTGIYLPVTAAVLGLAGVALIFRGAKK